MEAVLGFITGIVFLICSYFAFFFIRSKSDSNSVGDTGGDDASEQSALGESERAEELVRTTGDINSQLKSNNSELEDLVRKSRELIEKAKEAMGNS